MFFLPANTNLADLEEVKLHANHLPEKLSEAFETKLNMIDWYPDQFARANQYHHEMIGMLLDSNFTQKHRFLMCWVGQSPCNLVKWCDFCAFMRRMKLQRGFLTKFHSARFWFLTISFTGFLSFLGYDALDILVYWDAAINAIKEMYRDGIFQGVCWGEELHVQSLNPPLVEPHVHAVLVADDLGMGAIDDLHERIAAYHAPFECEPFKPEDLPASTFQVTRPITTRTYELKSQIDLAHVLGYMVKPINLPQCYLAAWPQAEANGRAGVPWLNQGVGDIIQGFELCASPPFWWERFNPRAPGQRKARRPHRRQFGYLGVLHSRHRDFVGVPCGKRDTVSQRQVVDAILKDQTVQKLMMRWEPGWLGQAVEELADKVGTKEEPGLNQHCKQDGNPAPEEGA